MLTAGCTCLYILMHRRWQHLHSVLFQGYEIHISALSAATQSGFWIFISSINRVIAWDLGLLHNLQLRMGVSAVGGLYLAIYPHELYQARLSFVKCLKHVAKWGLRSGIQYPTKVCLSLIMALDYQTWFRSWLLLAVFDNYSHQFQKPTKHSFITAKTWDPAGHPANISALLREDLAPVASTLSAKLSQMRRIWHQHNQKHGEREGWD